MDSILSDWLLERLDTAAEEPAYRQLFRLLQQAILSGNPERQRHLRGRHFA